MQKLLIFGFILALSVVVHSAALEYKKEGVICDRQAGFCADFMGVSVALTKLYLGQQAEYKLMDQIRKVGLESFDASAFTMSTGLTCKVAQATCWTDSNGGKVDKKATKLLFDR